MKIFNKPVQSVIVELVEDGSLYDKFEYNYELHPNGKSVKEIDKFDRYEQIQSSLADSELSSLIKRHFSGDVTALQGSNPRFGDLFMSGDNFELRQELNRLSYDQLQAASAEISDLLAKKEEVLKEEVKDETIDPDQLKMEEIK